MVMGGLFMTFDLTLFSVPDGPGYVVKPLYQ